MKLFVGVTDVTWFRNLASLVPPVNEVNFWRPSSTAFAAIEPGCPFLFKLKGGINKIGGVGFFHSYRRLPLRMAWETFTVANGRSSFAELSAIIARYNHAPTTPLTEIGCILLENPVFFDERDWIDVPPSMATNIVSGKTYDTADGDGARLWQRVSMVLEAGRGRSALPRPADAVPSVFGNEYLRKSRPGQAGFRMGLLDAYGRRCAITGENILPVLEAAHIQPVAFDGTNDLTNGLLLRSDMHTLYDDGLIGITPERTIRISDKIRELYVNGKVYRAWDGKPLTVLPADKHLLPSPERLEWHMNNVFEG